MKNQTKHVDKARDVIEYTRGRLTRRRLFFPITPYANYKFLCDVFWEKESEEIRIFMKIIITTTMIIMFNNKITY